MFEPVLREHHRYGPEHYTAYDEVRETDGLHFRVRHPEERPEDDFEVRGAVEDGVFGVVEGVCAVAAASSERVEVDAERAMLRAKKPLEWRSNLVGEEAHHLVRITKGRLFSKRSLLYVDASSSSPSRSSSSPSRSSSSSSSPSRSSSSSSFL